MSIGYSTGNSGQRGGGMRFIIAGVIALIAVVGYFAKTETNPVTGEKQHVGMNADQEMALGLQAAPTMAKQMGGILDPAVDAHAAKVVEIGKRLAYDTEAAKSPYAQEKQFHYYLLNDPQTVNAFALPGGQIFITRALYEKLENEAQLAGVLGHETGHVIHRHGAVQMAKGNLGGAIATAIGVAASDDQGHGQMAQVAAQMANQMLQLKYGRNDELQADAYGMHLMAQLNFDPAEMMGVMKILKDLEKGGRQPEMMQTHPYAENRMEQINEILERYKAEWSGKNFTKGAPLR